MSDSSNLQGLVSYGAFLEAEYSTENGNDVIEMTQEFSGERMLLVANDDSTESLEDRQELVTNRELFEQPLANFKGTMPDQSVITAMLGYTDIDIVGNETISANGNTEILIRNEGTENGRVQVRIAER
jgi:hypothetical protein